MSSASVATASVATASVDERYALITRGLQETLGEESIKKILAERDLKLYWGTATTGRPHIGYFVPIKKIADFLNAGCKVSVLFADLHAYLDADKASLESLEWRVPYYEAVIKAMLTSLGVDLDKLTFRKGTSFQLEKDYTMDMYKISNISNTADASRAGAEVVKQAEHPKLSGLLYPGLQALDEQYLDVDAQFGGVDQRKIFIYAEWILPALGYDKRAHLMNPMVPGLSGPKMSASDPNSKIDMLDSAEDVVKKMKAAFCPSGVTKDNGVIGFAEHVLFPLLPDGEPFTIDRPEKYGGPVSYSDFESMKAAYENDELSPADLKLGVSTALNKLMDPIRNQLDTDEVRDIIKKAYPVVKKEEAVIATPGRKSAVPAADDKREVSNPSRLDMRIGLIKSVQSVVSDDGVESESLYKCEVDVGESDPRIVVAGLKKTVPVDQLIDSYVVTLCNLKPAKLRGVMSYAMLLAASDATHQTVEPIRPPAGGRPGDVVDIQGYEHVTVGAPDAEINPKKAKGKVWDLVSARCTTNDDQVAVYVDSPFVTAQGNCTVTSLVKAFIR